ncbi:MAG: hypothetical protein M8357_09510 [Desulfobulbaceae bacterium]|nr:hypothetical protein [Desulfobulbaceae bacterium]
MLNRYIKTLAGVILYLLFCCLALVPVLAVRIHLENAHYAVAVTLWAFGAALFLVPALAIIIKKIWFFRGRGEPVTQAALEQILLGINDHDAPVHVKRQRKKIILTWRYQDRAWCELLEKKEMKKIYELRLGFDNNTKTVTMSDKYRSVDWSLSPIKVKTGWLVFSRPYFRVETGIAWGVENYVDSTPEDYTFSPNEIKSPILNTILKNGWNVRFSLF